MASIPGYTPQRQINFEVFKAAWKLFEMNPTVWLVTALVVVFAVGIPALLLGWLIPFVGHILAMLPGPILACGLLRMAFKQMRGEEISVGDAFDVADIIAPASVAGILLAIATSIGSFLFVIPGLIIGGLLLFTFPLIAERKCGDGIEALKLSFETLKPDLLMATAYFMVQGFILVAGALVCCVGLFVAGPIVILAQALLYRGYFPEQNAAPPAA